MSEQERLRTCAQSLALVVDGLAQAGEDSEAAIDEALVLLDELSEENYEEIMQHRDALLAALRICTTGEQRDAFVEPVLRIMTNLLYNSKTMEEEWFVTSLSNALIEITSRNSAAREDRTRAFNLLSMLANDPEEHPFLLSPALLECIAQTLSIKEYDIFHLEQDYRSAALALAEVLSAVPSNARMLVRDERVVKHLEELMRRNGERVALRLLSSLARECPRDLVHDCSVDFLPLLVQYAFKRVPSPVLNFEHLYPFNLLANEPDNLLPMFRCPGLLAVLIQSTGRVDPQWSCDVACVTLCHIVSAPDTVRLVVLESMPLLLEYLVNAETLQEYEMNVRAMRRALKVMHSLMRSSNTLVLVDNDQVFPFWRTTLQVWALLSARLKKQRVAVRRLPTEMFRLVHETLACCAVCKPQQ